MYKFPDESRMETIMASVIQSKIIQAIHSHFLLTRCGAATVSLILMRCSCRCCCLLCAAAGAAAAANVAVPNAVLLLMLLFSHTRAATDAEGTDAVCGVRQERCSLINKYPFDARVKKT